MGRHATAAGHDPQEPADATSTGLTRRPLSRYLSRLVLALTGGATTTLAVAWSGNAWSSAAVAGAAVAAVVVAAAWLAATVPPPPRPTTEEPSAGPGRPSLARPATSAAPAPLTTAPPPRPLPGSVARDPVQ